VTHHDALEFPDGQVVLLTRLCVGQRATVLQLPAAVRPKTSEEATLALRELSLFPDEWARVGTQLSDFDALAEVTVSEDARVCCAAARRP
jgi:hypothetical protein